MEFITKDYKKALIKVVGVGGCGGNIVNELSQIDQMDGVEFYAINTDAQALAQIQYAHCLQIGDTQTGGLGSGADPEKAAKAARDAIDEIRQIVSDCNMVFVAAGMGKGTGTGASEVVAEVARELGILTVAVVTRPFNFERRAHIADEGINRLCKNVDSLIVVPNQKLLEIIDKKSTIKHAYATSNQVLKNAVSGVSDIITKPGVQNLDFNDIKSVMSETGMAVIGSEVASGQDRAKRAAIGAIRSPLLDDVDMRAARGTLVNITTTEEVQMEEMEIVMATIQEHVQCYEENAPIFCGLVFDPAMGDDMRVTVIVTGIERSDVAQSHEVESTSTRSLLEKNNSPARHDSPRDAIESSTPTVGGGGIHRAAQTIHAESTELPNVFRTGRQGRELQEIYEAKGTYKDIPAVIRQDNGRLL